MTMRRVRKAFDTYDLGALRLYREDLRAIASAVAEAGDLTISCDDMYEATSPDDFDQFREDLRSVGLKATRAGSLRSIEVLLENNAATVVLAEADTLLTGVLQRIRLICEGRQRRLVSRLQRVPSPPRYERSAGLRYPQRMYGRPTGWLSRLLAAGFFLSLVSLFGLVAATTPKQPAPSAALITLAAVGGALGLGALATGVIERRPRVVIINAPQADRPTYWQRTRDIWQVGIVTTIFGVVVGYVLGKFT